MHFPMYFKNKWKEKSIQNSCHITIQQWQNRLKGIATVSVGCEFQQKANNSWFKINFFQNL